MGSRIERRGVTSSLMVRVAGVGMIACVAYLIGTQGVLEPVAQAAPAADSDQKLLIANPTPPVVVLQANQRALVGASDGLYYLVDYDGNSAVVTSERRTFLEWHRGPVPPISR